MKKWFSFILAGIPYAQLMFLYPNRKKLNTPFLNQKWVFQPLPPLFSKKRPKKAGETEGGKIIFLSRERKMIFLPSLCSTFFFPGKEKWFFFPLFEFFLFFLPGKEKSCFGPFGLFWPLWPLKHSLDLGITSKVEESHILHGKNDVTLDFFVSSDRSVSLGSLYPLGSQLQPSLRSCVKTTLGGKGCPRKHFCLRRKKNPRWHRFSMEERDTVDGVKKRKTNLKQFFRWSATNPPPE